MPSILVVDEDGGGGADVVEERSEDRAGPKDVELHAVGEKGRVDGARGDGEGIEVGEGGAGRQGRPEGAGGAADGLRGAREGQGRTLLEAGLTVEVGGRSVDGEGGVGAGGEDAAGAQAEVRGCEVGG